MLVICWLTVGAACWPRGVASRKPLATLRRAHNALAAWFLASEAFATTPATSAIAPIASAFFGCLSATAPHTTTAASAANRATTHATAPLSAAATYGPAAMQNAAASTAPNAPPTTAISPANDTACSSRFCTAFSSRFNPAPADAAVPK